MKRFFPVLLVTLIVLAGLMGANALAKEPVIRYWDALTRDPHVIARDMLIDEFEKQTGIKVEVTTITGDTNAKIQAAAAAGTLPDILFLWGAQEAVSYGQMEVVAPITDLINDVGAEYFANPRLLAPYELNGEYWGMPLVTFPGIMFYRKDVYDRHGLTAPATWDEWLDAARKTNEDLDGDGNTNRYGAVLGIGEDWPLGNLRASNADYWWDAEGNDTVGERTAEVFDFVRTLFDEACYPGSTTLTNEGQRLALLADQGASIVTSTSFLWPLEREKPEWLEEGIIAAAPVPVNRPGTPGAGAEAPSHCLAVVNGPNIDSAKEFLRFFMAKESLIKYFSSNIPGHLPPFSIVWDSDVFWGVNPNFAPIFSAGRETIETTEWQHPTVAWGSLATVELGYLMQRVTVDRWPTEKILDALHKGIRDAKAEFAR